MNEFRMQAHQLTRLLKEFGWLHTIKQSWNNQFDLVTVEVAQLPMFLGKEWPQDRVLWQHAVFDSANCYIEHTHPITRDDLNREKNSILARALYYSVPTGFVIDYLALVTTLPKDPYYPNFQPMDVTILRQPTGFLSMSRFLIDVMNGRIQIAPFQDLACS